MPASLNLCTHFLAFTRRLVPAACAAFVLAACGGGPERTGNVKSGAAAGDAVKVEARDNVFNPKTLPVNPGDEVTVEILNTGERPHDWTVDELNMSTGVMSPGQVFSVTFTAPDRDVKYVCTLHGGMEGTIKTA